MGVFYLADCCIRECCVRECVVLGTVVCLSKHGYLSQDEFWWGQWVGMGWKCKRGHRHSCCSSVGPREYVVLLYVVLGSVVSVSVFGCRTFFTSKIMIN